MRDTYLYVRIHVYKLYHCDHCGTINYSNTSCWSMVASHITNKPINLTPMPRKMSSKPSNKSNKKTRNSLLDLEIEATKLIKEWKKLDYQPLGQEKPISTADYKMKTMLLKKIKKHTQACSTKIIYLQEIIKFWLSFSFIREFTSKQLQQKTAIWPNIHFLQNQAENAKCKNLCISNKSISHTSQSDRKHINHPESE